MLYIQKCSVNLSFLEQGSFQLLISLRLLRQQTNMHVLKTLAYLYFSLQKFNINDDTKSRSTLLTPHFKVRAMKPPIIVKEHDYMSHVWYANAVACLMYVIVCTRPDLSQAVSMVSRYIIYARFQ